MPTNQELLDRRIDAVAQGIASFFPVFCHRASNAEVWDVEGKRYIDFASGIAVLNTGHLHPRVKQAVQEQLERFSHTAFQVLPYESYVALSERLNRIVPGDSPKKTLIVTTGAEAVENAVKIARAATGRSGLIAFGGAFHGRTMMALALTGKVAPYKRGFGPFPGECYHAPFPIAYHRVSVDQALGALASLFAADVDPQRVAAMIVEPVLGEGGFYPAPPEFLRALREMCDEHGIVLIVDEIQTGFARTGRMFASEYAEIEPDLITMAKSLAGGFPLSAVTGKASIMDAPAPGGLGGTYAGSPLACAAALAAIDVIEEEKLAERALEIGNRATARLEAMAGDARFACIGDVRHLGAMVAVELVKNRTTREPDPERTRALAHAAVRRGLVIITCGTRGNVVRFLTPLTISDEILNEGLDIFQDALTEVASGA